MARKKAVVINLKEGGTNASSNRSLPCLTPGCTEKIGQGSITGLCRRCYSGVYNWTKRSKNQLCERADKLRLYEARLNLLLPKDKLDQLGVNQTFKPLIVLPGQVRQYRRRPKQYKIMRQKQIG